MSRKNTPDVGGRILRGEGDGLEGRGNCLVCHSFLFTGGESEGGV